MHRKYQVIVDRILQKMNSKNIQRNPVLPIEDVKAFETKMGVKLPDELVTFYTEICNGCEMIDGFWLLEMADWQYDADRLKNDFPFSEYWIWEDDYDEERIKFIEDGNLELIDIGDAQTWNIIVSGNEKGKMWFFTDVGIQPCSSSKSFLEWFEAWLDGREML